MFRLVNIPKMQEMQEFLEKNIIFNARKHYPWQLLKYANNMQIYWKEMILRSLKYHSMGAVMLIACIEFTKKWLLYNRYIAVHALVNIVNFSDIFVKSTSLWSYIFHKQHLFQMIHFLNCYLPCQILAKSKNDDAEHCL